MMVSEKVWFLTAGTLWYQKIERRYDHESVMVCTKPDVILQIFKEGIYFNFSKVVFCFFQLITLNSIYFETSFCRYPDFFIKEKQFIDPCRKIYFVVFFGMKVSPMKCISEGKKSIVIYAVGRKIELHIGTYSEEKQYGAILKSDGCHWCIV